LRGVSCFIARRVAGVFLGLAVLLLGHESIAATVVDDNFDDGTDQGWTHYNPLAGFGAGGSFTVSGGAYRIQAPPPPNPTVVGPGRAGSLRLDTNFADFFVSVDIVDWVDTADQAFGILARTRDVGLGTTDGYAFFYVPVDRNFEMDRIDNEDTTSIAPIIDLTLDPERDYRLTFSGKGEEFTGEVFDLADLTTPLITMTGFDVTYADGVTGLVVADASSGGVFSDATFDNFHSTIPEPQSGALIAAAALLAMMGSMRGIRLREARRADFD
jgi:hypothetical protein